MKRILKAAGICIGAVIFAIHFDVGWNNCYSV